MSQQSYYLQYELLDCDYEASIDEDSFTMSMSNETIDLTTVEGSEWPSKEEPPDLIQEPKSPTATASPLSEPQPTEFQFSSENAYMGSTEDTQMIEPFQSNSDPAQRSELLKPVNPPYFSSSNSSTITLPNARSSDSCVGKEDPKSSLAGPIFSTTMVSDFYHQLAQLKTAESPFPAKPNYSVFEYMNKIVGRKITQDELKHLRKCPLFIQYLPRLTRNQCRRKNENLEVFESARAQLMPLLEKQEVQFLLFKYIYNHKKPNLRTNMMLNIYESNPERAEQLKLFMS
ncbi:hypothetical protein TRFO_28926 [Tritrichomonas foetus]|uniref:Uncharacterized protein n=1 Tax=Tritrichomonas foetus TaxID=1144522 RepID=A0A1J4K1I8_9EUKA|nr:hypothetical protein TRFO_28926 [Tritrichomonas foetus]|eukprot:OHT03614.1 hypothetical protein TRFO_28926 [Tritrichomonas foetus]